MASIEDMIKEAQGPVPRRRQDSMRATPRNAALGSVADLLAAASSPERTQHMQMMADTFQLPSMAKTLDLLSYGEPLTTGAGGLGGTTRVKPEVMDTAMNLAPFAGDVLAATKGLPVGMGTKMVSGKAAKAVAAAEPKMSEAQKAVMSNWGSSQPSGPSSALSGALAPSKQPVRGNTSAELQRMQKGALNDEQKELLETYSQKHPGFGEAAKFMTPQELTKILGNPNGIREMTRLLEVLPQAKELASVTKAGAEKQGWYRASTQALIDVFGVDDAPRFAALLAAQSPQTSVEMNLTNSLNTWKNWTAAGRPTDAKSIKAIMGQSVAGTKGEESVLDAWVNNSVRALSNPDPTKVVLSGPKVDSFFHNLADDVYRVTNDAWMSNGLKVSQQAFSGSPTALQLAAGDPGLSPGYIGTNVRMRQAAQKAGMYPSEAQETAWSWFMPLMEMQTSTGMPAREILQKGLLTPEMIRGTPDFSSLLRQGNYGKILEEAGYGDQLAALKPHDWQRPKYDMSMSDQRNLEDIAGNLENLGRMRQSSRRFTSLGMPAEEAALPETGFFTKNQEYIPGQGTGHLEYLINAPESVRKNVSSKLSNAFNDQQNRNLLMGAAGYEPLPTTPFTGSFRPPGGIGNVGPRAEPPFISEKAFNQPGMGLRPALPGRHAMETQPGYGSTVELPIRFKGEEPSLNPKDQSIMDAISAIEGGMTAQLGTPYSGAIPHKTGPGLFVKSEKKVPAENMSYAGSILDPGTEAVADTGRGATVLNWGDSFNKSQADKIKEMLGGSDVLKVHTPGNYIDYSGEFAAPQGSGAVTQKMLDYFSKMPKSKQNAVSEAAKRPAEDVYDIYRKLQEKTNEPTREDLMNMLEIIKKYGIAGLPAALASGVSLAGQESSAIPPSVSDLAEEPN